MASIPFGFIPKEKYEMSAYIVSYDLNQHGQNYTCIINKLKAYSSHWHMQGSVWIVVTDQTASEVRDYLKPCLDANDQLFVGLLSAAAWFGYSDEVGEWLKSCIK